MAGKLRRLIPLSTRLGIPNPRFTRCKVLSQDANDYCAYTDEPRRSVRATKGQHTKDRDLPDQQPPAKGAKGKKGKGKGGKAVSSEPDEADEEDAIIRCICGATEDDEGLMMIVCDKCEAWQHNLCMDVTEVEDELLNEYYCEQCAPDKHVELLAAIDRGEKPWEAKKKQRQDEEKARKKAKKGKKGRGGGTKPRPSDVTATPAGDDSSIADSAVKVDTGNKRKLAENGFKDVRYQRSDSFYEIFLTNSMGL